MGGEHDAAVLADAVDCDSVDGGGCVVGDGLAVVDVAGECCHWQAKDEGCKGMEGVGVIVEEEENDEGGE